MALKSFKTYLKETTFPETHWGYWITDDGKILVVDNAHDHGLISLRYDQNKYADNGWIGPHDNGWIRIVSGVHGKGQTNISLNPKKVTKKALFLLRDFLRQEKSDFYFFDLLGGGKHYETSRQSEAMYFVNKLITKQDLPLFETEIPFSNYGYWLKPDGTFIKVGFQEHSDTAYNNGMMGYSDSYSHGWVRIEGIMGGNHANFQLTKSKLTLKAKLAIREFIRQLGDSDDDRYNFIYINNDGYKTKAAALAGINAIPTIKPEALPKAPKKPTKPRTKSGDSDDYF